MESVMNEDNTPERQARLCVAANDEEPRPLATLQQSERPATDLRPRFDIYRADQVTHTSVLFCGGDWHWSLTDSDGQKLADCGGYPSRSECREAVVSLRNIAGDATIPGPL